MEDVQIARATAPAMQTVPIAATATKLVYQSDKRFSLVISASKTVDIYLGFDANVAVAAGILIPANTSPVLFDLEHHGSIVKGTIWAISSAGTVNVTFMETNLERTE